MKRFFLSLFLALGACLAFAQCKLIETTDSQRHGGWVRDGAGGFSPKHR